MVFKKMLGALGIGGLSVDTVLEGSGGHPGAPLTGRVDLVGGSSDAEIEQIGLALVARMEVESGDSDRSTVAAFHRVVVSGPRRLAEGERVSLPFRIDLPWETPITAVFGQSLHGMVMGLRTEVAIARAVDKSDLDPVQVHALPVQQRILEAFTELGFVFKGADLEYGQLAGVAQSLPFYQEIEFFPAPQYARSINEVELTFLTHPHGVEVILEFDKRGGLFSRGQDSFGRYRVAHAEAETTDWVRTVDGWVRQSIEQRQSFFGSHGYGSQKAHGGGHHGGHRGGSGMGGMAMGLGGGLVAGYAASEIMDEVFEDEGDEEA